MTLYIMPTDDKYHQRRDGYITYLTSYQTIGRAWLTLLLTAGSRVITLRGNESISGDNTASRRVYKERQYVAVIYRLL